MKSNKLHAASAVPASVTRPTPRWRATALALAAALVLGAAPGDADALALGRVTVLSALGEPLRAEIDVPQISAEEAASLRAALASPEAFRAAGLEYSTALSGVQISLQRSPNGGQVLVLSGDRPVNDPFVDVIVEANWANGRVVRNITMLFDPPQLRAPAPIAAQVSPQASGIAAQRPTPPSALGPASAPAAAAGPAPAPSSAPSRATARASRQEGQPATAPAARPGQKVTVQSGDSAGRIAATHKPAAVSLDQMLVALLRSNPDAFMGGNINRLKAGAVLDLPSAEQAGAIGRDEARQTVVAQSRDFNEFRRRLAEGVGGTAQADAAGRSAAGRLQAQVQDKSGAPATPDRLTLSKGAVQAQRAAQEERLARERSTRDADTRVAELNKNIAELNRVAAAAAAAAAPGAAASSPAEATGPAIAAGTPPVGGATPASAPGGATSAAAPAATSSSSAKPAAPGATASGVVDTLLGNPLLPAAGAGLLALLLGFGWYRIRQGRKAALVDSSFLESRLQPDSFFGASGGQRIDTAESANATASSMVYSPSQLDAAGDVDPVAEADVYLAYGRDLQAEEILKEALRVSPQRVAIHGKLLEIYARRRDVKAFDLIASEAHALTQGVGHEWEHIAALGQELDPSNPMYRPGGWRAGTTTPTAGGAAAMAAASAIAAQPPAVQPASGPIDLDLDFSLDHDTVASPLAQQVIDTPEFDDTHASRTMPIRLEPAAVKAAVQAETPEPPPDVARASGPSSVLPALDLSFDDEPTPPDTATAPTTLAQAVKVDLPDLNLPGNAIDFALPAATASAAPPAPAASKPAASGPDSLMDFDLDSLSFDLATPDSQIPADAKADADAMSRALPELTGDDGGDPLATKLALAEEFNAIGDPDGARSLAQEVLAEASGDLRQRAQRLLADIG